MPISFVASTRSPTTYPSSTNNTSTCVLAKPTGTVQGDVVLVFLESGGGSTFTYPTGWREVSRYENTAAVMTSTIAYKVMTATEASSYTFSDSQGDGTPLCGMLLTYRGVDIDDPINDPINAHGESNTGTTGTSAVNAPTVVSTEIGWYVWFRAGKIGGTTNPTVNSFTTSGGTAVARQATANRGGSTEYFVDAADSNSIRNAQSNSGATFTRVGSGTFNGSLARTIVLKQATPPTEGAMSATLGGLTYSAAGTVHNDATVAATLGGISIAAAGEHFPPAVGPMAVQLGGISQAFAGNGTGGGFAASLAPVVVGFAGAVNPIGTFDASLASVEISLSSETRVFGENVIIVEAEKRALKITQDETIPIYKSEVGFEPLASPFSMTLAPVGMSFTAETTSGAIELNLGSIGVDWDAQIIYGGFASQLGAATISLVGGTIGGTLNYALPPAGINLLGAAETSGDFDGVQLGGIEMHFTDSPAGPIDIDLGGIEVESEGTIIVGDFDGVELGGVTVAFEALSTTEDLLKYAADIGDGTATTYTVTHNASTRDVVVTVFDNSTYEEVVPLTVHATTNTVTVQFASAPSSNAYRVVVLYSSV